ncbi:MAG: N-6 DNA methylase [Proteobacteria bacterium]|nr:N-6 DNA methylase [Pseudomonadota bacterium]
MLAEQIQSRVHDLCAQEIASQDFIQRFLRSYGLPSAAYSFARNSQKYPKTPLEFFKRESLYFKALEVGRLPPRDLSHLLSEIVGDPRVLKHRIRFLIVTDFTTLLAQDTIAQDTLRIPLKNLAKHYDFFLPLAGIDKECVYTENPIDRKAAEKLAELYCQIINDNPQYLDKSDHHKEELNQFLCRLIFCFFAEDSGLFKSHQFTESVLSHTAKDGSDLSSYIAKIFSRLSSKHPAPHLSQTLQDFPYVNGSFFEQEITLPKLTRKSRNIIRDFGHLDWASINPDIFGSMIQAVEGNHTNGNRKKRGMDYTSPQNIRRVINPLFLDHLKQQFAQAKGSQSQLTALLNRIYKLQIFDPACGSGNFLIITFKELRRLESAIFSELGYTNKDQIKSGIELKQFFGIEIEHFPTELAKLSLYIAEHQMNRELRTAFALDPTTSLPLSAGGSIICANALRYDWTTLCDFDQELYIVANPPYKSRNLTREQKQDMSVIASSFDQKFGRLDYVSGWFIKLAKYLQKYHHVHGAFVATSSICQGNHAQLLWPILYHFGVEISFAYQSFPWANKAVGNAGVHCVIVGLRSKLAKNKQPKILIWASKTLGSRRHVPYINSYLRAAKEVIIKPTKYPPSHLPRLINGSAMINNGNLILSESQAQDLTARYPQSQPLIFSYMSAEDVLYDRKRFVVKIRDTDLQVAREVPEIHRRLEAVRQFRSSRKDLATQKIANTPHKWERNRYQHLPCLALPRVSSERRNYLPITYLTAGTVVSNANFVMYLQRDEPEYFMFAILSSQMHMTWVKAYGGKFGSSIRYSSTICYNAYPWPDISPNQRSELRKVTFNIFAEREHYPYKTLAELYDPDKMPAKLKELHAHNDQLVDSCYRERRFSHDEERLEFLTDAYAKQLSQKTEITTNKHTDLLTTPVEKMMTTFRLDNDHPYNQTHRRQRCQILSK